VSLKAWYIGSAFFIIVVSRVVASGDGVRIFTCRILFAFAASLAIGGLRVDAA
jgi:hypothetical protein